MFQTSAKHKYKRASVVGALFWFYIAIDGFWGAMELAFRLKTD